jgi:HEAT repeat protein
MPITVRCPNDRCAKSFRLQDAAAGKTGKCPVCGARIVIPNADPAAVPMPDGAAPRTAAFARTGPRPAPATTADPPAAAPAAVTAAVIRFEAIGEAWRLLWRDIGVWIVAALFVAFGSAAVHFALFLLSIPISIMVGAFLPGELSFIAAFGSSAVSFGISGVFIGGMYRMALHQVDGDSMGLKDLLPGSDVVLTLALASLLATVAAYAGFMCLVIPGWIISGILMFTMPLVVDARLKAVDALSLSWKTLKDQWLPATVFALVLWTVQLVGLLFCGLGSLVTLPLSVLSHSILYRGFFPRGGEPARPAWVVDPDFGPVAVAATQKQKGRIPGWAWFAASAGLLALILVPIVIFGLGIAMIIGMVSWAHQDIRAKNEAFQKALQDASRKIEKQSQEAGQAPAQPALPGAGAGFAPKLGGLRGPEISDATGALAGLRGNLFERQAALKWLIVTKPAEAEPDRAKVASALAALLADPFDGREAAEALAAWATADQIPTLVWALDHQDIAIQRKAEEALRRLKDEGGLAALEEHEKRRDVRDAIPRVQRRPGTDLGDDTRKLMERRSRQIREKATELRKGFGRSNQIDLTPFAADLKKTDEGACRRALERLARLTPNPEQHDEVINLLEPLVGDPLPTLRAAAVKVLAVWANEDDVPALIGAVDDNDAGVRHQALAAFSRIKDERAVGPVARHLADPEIACHTAAVRTLKQIGSIAEKEVVKYLGADDIRVRERACQVLQSIGTRDSIPALSRAASVRSPVSRTAQAALNAIAARGRRK